MEKLFLGLTILIFLSSCSKDYSADSLLGSWKVLELSTGQEDELIQEEGNVIINFEENRLTFEMTFNSCGSGYLVFEQGKIELTAPICSRLCCNSETEVTLLQIFDKMTDFEVRGRKLTLLGNGVVKLKRI